MGNIRLKDNSYGFKRLTIAKFVVVLVLGAMGSGLVVGILLEIMKDYGWIPTYLVPMVENLAINLVIIGPALYLLFRCLDDSERRKVFAPAESLVRFSPWLLILLVCMTSLWDLLTFMAVEQFFPAFFTKLMESPLLAQNAVPKTGFDVAESFISGVIIAPIIEEIIFRGIFFNLLAEKRSIRFAMWVSAIIFSLLHGIVFLGVLVIGLVLAYVYHVSGDIRYPMLLHGLNNFLAFVISLNLQNENFNLVLNVVIIFLGVLGFILGIRYLLKRRGKGDLAQGAPLYRDRADGYL